ncbi:MAG TPA: M23 family metallopeptidase [Patescibacteria group bacterium]
MGKIYILILIIIPVIYSFVYFPHWTDKLVTFYSQYLVSASTVSPLPTPSAAITSAPALVSFKLSPPVKDYLKRITKKPFGIYVTPQNSPVKPERFTGYHTGADAEFTDIAEKVDVKAAAPGTVIYSAWTSGYGGLIAIAHNFNGQKFITLYGHLAPSSLIAKGAVVNTGDTIGQLGKGFSVETDGERKHLHFAVLKGSTLNVRGYVQKKSDLGQWFDPQTLF